MHPPSQYSTSYNQKMPAPRGLGDIDVVYIISALASIVTVAAGYIATDKGQRALADITAARFLPPLDAFVFSMLAAMLLFIASRRLQALDDFPAIFLMFAASSISDILLQCRSLAWIVYVPCGILVMLLVYKMPARRGLGDIDVYVYIISALASIVTVAAGYIATDKGQRALADITAARYLPPLDVFVFSILAAILLFIASRRLQALDDFPAIFLMFAASSISDILLQGRSLAWIVYVPCGILVLFLVYKVSRLLFSWVSAAILSLLLEFFIIHGIGMLKRMVTTRLRRMVTEGPAEEMEMV